LTSADDNGNGRCSACDRNDHGSSVRGEPTLAAQVAGGIARGRGRAARGRRHRRGLLRSGQNGWEELPPLRLALLDAIVLDH
jgi:hypothetical protein